MAVAAGGLVCSQPTTLRPWTALRCPTAFVLLLIGVLFPRILLWLIEQGAMLPSVLAFIWLRANNPVGWCGVG